MKTIRTEKALTRTEALDCGEFIDVTEEAKSAGLCVPTAFTWKAYSKATYHPDQDWHFGASDAAQMTLEGLVEAITRRAPKAGHTLVFQDTAYDIVGDKYPLALKAVMSRDDNGRPCLTVMLADEN